MALSEPLAVVVVGAAGRLGALVCSEAAREPSRYRVHARVGRGDSLERALGGANVVIDVSTAGATSAHAAACAKAGVPLVVATTGFSAADHAALGDASKAVAVLTAANLSLSAHVAARLVAEAAARLPGYDVEVVEVHHNKKKDAPSGTALMLATAAIDARKEGHIVRARDGVAPRAAGDVGVSAVRGGDVVGEHTVSLFGEGERIEIVHRITSRAVFARGALAAARFLAGKPAGRYTMADVLTP